MLTVIDVRSIVPYWHVHDPGYTAKSAGGGLHLKHAYTLDPTKSGCADQFNRQNGNTQQHWPSNQFNRLYGNTRQHWPSYQFSRLYGNTRQHWPSNQFSRLYGNTQQHWPSNQFNRLYGNTQQHWPSIKLLTGIVQHTVDSGGGDGLFLACEDCGRGSRNKFPASAYLKSGDQLVRTISTKISPQWLSELRRLRASVPWRVASEFVSLIGFHTMHGQHCQPAPTSCGYCKHCHPDFGL